MLLQDVANIVRGLSADAVEEANSGHPGLPIGCAEIGTLLYGEIMKHDPTDPDWPDRDRFVLSAGHGSMLLYSLLYLSGYDLSMEDIKNFRQLGSKTPGHPEFGHTPGVETTTGPLGQGFANAVGMAIAERMMAEKYNTQEYTIVDHYTYTLIGDGGMMEGVVAEAASLAGHLGLGKLIAIYDDNDISISGSTDITFTESVAKRFEAYEWHVIDNVDGHNFNSLREAILKAKEVKDKPSLIIAKTRIAYGAPTKEGSAEAHGAPLGKDEVRGLKNKLGLPVDKKFYVSEQVEEFFSSRIEELKSRRLEWEEKFNKWGDKNPDLKKEWENSFNFKLPENLRDILKQVKIDTPVATRKASGALLQKIADEVPYLIGGAADLAPSTKTYLDNYDEIKPDNFSGRNFRFGVREHAMGAIMNGIAVHKGFKIFGATFLVFSDYMRPAIRMAALMGLPVIYVFTHDSIYIGEDGPTHQPVEHIESLRLIPNLKVLRPADEEETREAWIEALSRVDGPTALILTRQSVPHINKFNGVRDFHRGGYIVKKESSNKPDLVIMASGSEVSLAFEVAGALENKGKYARVISVPDRNEFVRQSLSYLKEVIGEDLFHVIIEAGTGSGWYQLGGNKYYIISVEEFGVSGPGQEVAKKYGFNVETIANDIMEKI